jgi:hypothetical protein
MSTEYFYNEPAVTVEEPQMNQGPSQTADAPAPVEGFTNLKWNGVQVDLILKAIFFGCIFYLLSLPEVYKMTKKCCKQVDGVLLHSIVFAVLYFILVHFI